MNNFQIVTLSELLGKKESLGTRRLFEHLDAQLQYKNRRQAINLLAQIAIRLHKLLTEKNMSLYDADRELLLTPGYSQGPVLQRILELKKENSQLVLFNRQAFKLIYHLLLLDIDYGDRELDTLPPVEPYDEFSPVGIFLIANETLLDLQKNRHGTAEESIDIRDFYSRCLVDPAGAVGRSRPFYDTPYFNQELQKRVGVSVQDVRLIAFDHFVHVLSKDPAVFDLATSFKLPKEMRPALEAISSLLTVRYKSQKIKFSELIEQLDLDLSLEKKIRGKPLLEVDGASYCLCPELLSSPLADLPYHLIWSDMKSKGEQDNINVLRDERGKAFQEYITALSERILGKDICHRPYLKKDGEFGDQLIDLAPEEKLIIEWKVAEPLDLAKGGNIKEIIKRFLLPPKRKGSGREHPGPLQVMDAAMDYRKKHSYKGQIHTAVGYYGWFPEVAAFDDAYSQEIKTAETCLEYEKEQINIPTILWNAFTWELMLSAVKQSASPDRSAPTVLREMLELLKPYANHPSKSSQVIEDYFREKGLKFSVAPLFSDEIHKLAKECQSKLTAPPEIVEKVPKLLVP